MNKVIKDIMNDLMLEYDNSLGDWLGSENERFLRIGSPKSKGSIMEKLTIRTLTENGYTIEPRITADQDFIFEGEKVELKGSCRTIKTTKTGSGSYTFFQLRQYQDYSHYIFLTIEPNDVKIYKISKEDLLEYLEKNIKEIAFPGGKKKVNMLKAKYGNDPKDWLKHHDIFHWSKSSNKEWPKGTVELV